MTSVAEKAARIMKIRKARAIVRSPIADEFFIRLQVGCATQDSLFHAEIEEAKAWESAFKKARNLAD